MTSPVRELSGGVVPVQGWGLDSFQALRRAIGFWESDYRRPQPFLLEVRGNRDRDRKTKRIGIELSELGLVNSAPSSHL